MIKSDKYNTYYIPFSFGNWINETIGFLKIKYLAERKNAFNQMITNSLKDSVNKMGQVTFNNDDRIKAYSPDKALLFTYVSFNKDAYGDLETRKEPFVYHLTNGYTYSYHFSEEVSERMKRPFEDVFWYATQEGVSYLAWPTPDNKEIFSGTIPAKIKSDYFRLYIKVLYQSFSLLIYADRIQKEILADHKRYLKGPIEEEVTELYGEINLFLTKSMATSVSHIHHQSEFYIYLKEQLRIREDVTSVTSGLNALESLQREEYQRELREENENKKKRDEKIQAIMGLFAMLGISSALVDTFDFIGKFKQEGEWSSLSFGNKVFELFSMGIVEVIGIVAIAFAIKAVCDAFIDIRKGKKKK